MAKAMKSKNPMGKSLEFLDGAGIRKNCQDLNISNYSNFNAKAVRLKFTKTRPQFNE